MGNDTDQVAMEDEESPHTWVQRLAVAHPGYDFQRYSVGIGFKWTATALRLDGSPWCIVTGDPREFAAHLPGLVSHAQADT